MIDSITVIVPLHHVRGPGGPFYRGDVVSLSPDAEKKGQLVQDWSSPKRAEIEGSYKNVVVVKSIEAGFRVDSALTAGQPALWISGSPAKFMQGHNVFGSSDLRGIVAQLADYVCDLVGIVPTEAERKMWCDGYFDVHRVDVTRSIRFKDLAQVRAVLHALSSQARMRFRGSGQFKGDSLIFGLGSRRSSLLFYAKGAELDVKGHRLPVELGDTNLREWADGLLRIEARVRTLDLIPHGLHHGVNWGDNSVSELHAHYMNALEIADTTMIEAATLDGLSFRLQLIYGAWKSGTDLRATLKRPTFYRYRNELLKHGIDIAVKQDSKAVKQAPNLRLVLTLDKYDAVPDWAVGTPLYFEPRAKAA